jgi:adenosylmethionine-8-amino-7-oxononanoate aminotransferase
MTHVIHRSLRATPPVAVASEGVHIVDASGKRYLDACGGAAVSSLGHATPRCSPRCTRRSTSSPTRTPRSSPARRPRRWPTSSSRTAPAGLDQVYLVSGGSEAIESALKLARQHFVELGSRERTTFVARRQSYHGNTLGALAVGGNEWRARSSRRS